jgi:hypothetical protein
MEKMEHKFMDALIGRLLKIDKVSEGTHKNKGSVQVQQLSNNNSNNGVTYGVSKRSEPSQG